MSACLTRSVGLESTHLRRTMSSADISSIKSFSSTALKKVASLDRLSDHQTHSTWMPIQKEEKEEEEEGSRLQSSDIWSSILSQKKSDEEEGKNAPPPYIHPLVKRSASTLSEKSLEICTESLGSETGSDGFDKIESSKESPITQMEDVVDDAVSSFFISPVMPQQQSLKKVTSVRCFPPPLAHRGDGSNVQMRSHREDGRLVLEAVSVPNNACFKAERQDGRLLLSFSPASEAEEEDENQEIDSDSENQEIDYESDSEYEEVVMMNQDEFVERVGVRKFLDLTRSFPRRLNRVVKTIDDDEDEEEEEDDELLNSYVYGWRNKVGGPVVVAQLKEEKEKVLEVDAKNGDMFLKGCNLQQKQHKLVMWDHRCIAT